MVKNVLRSQAWQWKIHISYADHFPTYVPNKSSSCLGDFPASHVWGHRRFMTSQWVPICHYTRAIPAQSSSRQQQRCFKMSCLCNGGWLEKCDWLVWISTNINVGSLKADFEFFWGVESLKVDEPRSGKADPNRNFQLAVGFFPQETNVTRRHHM